MRETYWPLIRRANRFQNLAVRLLDIRRDVTQQQPLHAGIARLVRDCNRFYRDYGALHELDTDPRGFEWLDFSDAQNSVLAFLRRARDPSAAEVIVALNATPVVRYGYRIGVPRGGEYAEILNTDSEHYGGGNVGNQGSVRSEDVVSHGKSQSLMLTLPPLALVAFARTGGEDA